MHACPQYSWCVASPHSWRSPASLPAVNGSVRCLAMFVDEQGDEQVRCLVAQCSDGCLCRRIQRCCTNYKCLVWRQRGNARMHGWRAACCHSPWLPVVYFFKLFIQPQIMAIAPALLPELLAILRRCARGPAAGAGATAGAGLGVAAVPLMPCD